MKKLFFLLFAVCMFNSVALHANQNYNIRQAILGAVDKAAQKIKTANFGNRPIAIFPLDKYSKDINLKLQNMLNRAGFVCVNIKDDPMWDVIFKEIEWDERKNDIFDKTILDKFGKLKSAQILLRCHVSSLHVTPECVFAAVDMQALEISTGAVLWGDTFGYSYCIGKDVKGIVNIDRDMQRLLQKNFAAACKSLKEPFYAARLDKVKTVTVIPLAGDIDNFITRLANEMLTDAGMYPRDPHIASVSAMRAIARDGQISTDAILYGAVRDLYRSGIVSGPSGESIISSYTLNASIQLTIEDAKNGNILWTKTVPVSEVVRGSRAMNAQEKAAALKNKAATRELELQINARIREMEMKAKNKQRMAEIENDVNIRKMELKAEAELNSLEQENRAKVRKAKVDSASEILQEDLIDNWKSYLKIIAFIIGGIVLIALAIVAIKAFFSYNNIR